LKQDEIYSRIEKRLPNYDTFENLVRKHLEINYFSFAYQSFYTQIGYDQFPDKKFNTYDFKEFVRNNNFVDLVNEIYRTRLSSNGVENIKSRLQEIGNFDDYETALMVFKKCNPRKYKNGDIVVANAWSLGTKILHFYNPQENPILDSVVRENLKIGNMDAKLCIEFRKATNEFVNDNVDFFDSFLTSSKIKFDLKERGMTYSFSKMGLLDMALYEKIE
jgi:hypothetical protein